ncbi:Opacity-associated protein A LysM-like domain [Phocoenobacter uteri]|uniref:Opacity-associated protein A LysM-like domain n=1 Tax=Phocoenobacter uteri TaxID=146806 RepID=A0A379CCK2_9PAST|nr:LysM-like peptidoglycan-binding domain-containing protein [Phocoenobacter uteri]MDG6881772.1 hypothetical protein [Phocoenobacter uteri]SUB59809.1 Opacity-associated protein A LysM-like domain [Phocoenobacter uteri]
MSENNLQNESNLENTPKKKSKLNLTYPKPDFAYKGPKFTENKDMSIEKPTEVEEQEPSTNVIPDNIVSEKTEETVEESQPFISHIAPERVIPVTSTPKEKTVVKENFFAKYKRLLLVLLILLLLFIAFWALKPSTPKIVEELKNNQENDLPIEFRPIDAEEAKRAEEAKKALLAQKEAESKEELQKTEEQRANAILNATEQPTTDVVEKADNAPATPDIAAVPDTNLVAKTKATDNVIVTEQVAKPVKQKVEEVKKAHKIEKPASKVKPQPKSDTKTKVLVMKDGVSLMQLFRNHHLRISDVNAMTKAKGASRVFRHLNQGDKVVLHLDNHNRVTSMSVKGGRFIRQSNGTYIYKK